MAAEEEQYFPSLPPAHGKFVRFYGRIRQGVFEIAYSSLCTDPIRNSTIVEKMDICILVGVAKDTGLNNSL